MKLAIVFSGTLIRSLHMGFRSHRKGSYASQNFSPIMGKNAKLTIVEVSVPSCSLILMLMFCPKG